MSELNENAKKWVEALRSGKFHQTKECLYDDRGYCCLGVACHIMYEGDDSKYEGSDGELPDEVRDWLGLDGNLGEYHDGEEFYCDLVTLNDDRNYTFAQIADVIESKPSCLFVDGR